MSDWHDVLEQIERALDLLDDAGIPKGASLAVRVGLLIDERNSLKDELEGLKAQCESMGILGLRVDADPR